MRKSQDLMNNLWHTLAKGQHALKVLCFLFPFKVCGGGVFPTCSLQVPNMFPRFPLCFPRVFPIHFNPICFAQSPPLLTYIGGPKGKALHLSIESFILGSLHGCNFFLWWANQIGSLLISTAHHLWPFWRPPWYQLKSLGIVGTFVFQR